MTVDNVQQENSVITTELSALLGKHWLDAVDFSGDFLPASLNDANTIRIRLDGIAYTVVEDSEDGYRSSLGEVFTSDGADMKNVFSPVWVFGKWKDGNTEYIIELVDVWTGKVVIEVGTDYSDDYYPAFVSYFSPENMVHNLQYSS